MNDDELTGALTVAEFCRNYHLGRTKLYEEIKSGRIFALKLGSKTLIRRSEAERWVRSLPKLDTAKAA